MSARPRLLDLFCAAGGASAGYHAAGFDVTGVDIEPQPHYPFPFIRADALTVDLDGYDVIAASPPCQRYSTATPADRRDDHPDLVAPVRERLRQAVATGTAWAYVIENVPGSPLLDPVLLCGDTLRLGVRRHRLFESNVGLRGTGCHHDRDAPAVPVYGTHGQRPAGRNGVDVDGETSRSTAAETGRVAMGIDWMPWDRLTQAIPPAYTAWLGTQLLTHPDRPPVPVTQATRTQPSRPLLTNGTGGLRHCHCGAPLTRPATGRWPRHCSHACRQAAYRARGKEAS
ncbi:DNA cytosine methyltransferase [Actinosynnema pretiosum subsp. pretiosum]|uniref:DNA cytosine methyltransferase n=1 Tax=Actinosynnema pretiosum subsp. pretiosum TaxID=103721 RepID=A0AA45L9W6_9PSEU|nr:hypothetical protein APASM_2030 [Actinosynnema pretiosum subsp. pretiosum]QUF06359.1 DNA cytosine methyltransferase [Actinosynnema pretiosum subsp. pretiosum]